MGHQQLSDEELARAAFASADAFGYMAARMFNRVYFTALAMVGQPEMAEDIAQETFLRVWLKRESIKPDAIALQPWLTRIARNLAIDWLRSGQQRSRVLPLISLEETTVDPADNTKPGPRQSAGDTETNAQLTEAVMALPDELRQAVLLHYGEGLTASDIARLNGEAPSTVTRRLEKAREQLRTWFESGLATSLAALKPRPRQTEKFLAVLIAAATLPAATRAEILNLTANTPPPPLINTVPSAAQTAASQGETTIMQNLIGKVGAAKLFATAAAVGILGAGVYAVNTIAGDSESSTRSTESTPEQLARFGFDDSAASRPDASAKLIKSRSSNDNSRKSLIATTETSTNDRPRASLTDRISRLKSETVATNPELVIADGETSGKIYFNLQVVDAAGLPVSGATIKPTGLRKLIDSAGWYGWRLEPVNWVTNPQGIVRAYVPQYTEEKLETGGITFTTSHPEYTPVRSDMRLTSITKVVLTAGNVLDVIASDEKSSSPIIGGITVEPYGGAESAKDWSQRNDGTISIRRIGDQGIKFYLKHKGETGNVQVSDYQVVEFPRPSDEPLRVTLHPTFTVRGRLSDNVPRPVTNGKVAAHVLSGPNDCGAYARTEVDVTSDGNFELKEMPGGTIQIWALTNGFCSVSNAVDSPYEMAQRFELTENNQNYILPMEPTATVRFTVTDSNGNPVSGVIVSASPNICYESCCGIWFNRRFITSSDEAGLAIIEFIPPDKTARFHVSGDWELEPHEQSSYRNELTRDITLELQPGAIIDKPLTVYPRGTFTISADGDKMTSSSTN